MRNAGPIVLTAAALLGFAAPMAHAQRGVADPTGVAQRPVKPETVALSGKIVEVRTGPCEFTTGRSLIGTHLILETAEKEQLNVHLGPAGAVADVVSKLSEGQEIAVTAFRTEKMKEKHYVAQSLTLGKVTLELRGAGLRPIWAGGSVGSRGAMAGRAGLGRGRGSGWGRGGRGRGGLGRGRGFGWGGGGQRWLAPPQPAAAAPEPRPGTPGKIAVTAVEPSMEAAVDPRFGRCPYFLLVDAERDTFEAVQNTNTTPGNAGVHAVEVIARKGAKVLLTGECGPNALRALAAAGIQVFPGCSGTVRAVVKQFKAGQLPPASRAKAKPDSARAKVPAPGRRP
jgi:predicted Fe-Mo cluster-binding NifX family protein